MKDYRLVGHACPFGRYPDVVLPVGVNSIEQLVVIYESPTGPCEDVIEWGHDEAPKYVEHGPELQLKLQEFDPEHERLFAHSPKDVEFYAREIEPSFFECILDDPRHRDLDPFVRLTFAKRTQSAARVIDEIGRCIKLVSITSPGFVSSWCQNEAAELVRSYGSGQRHTLIDPSHKRIVLIIDDDKDTVEEVGNACTAKNYEVRKAFNAEMGLQFARESLPSLIFLDLGLPDLDGYEVLSRLREDPEFNSTLIIILTAKVREGQALKGADRVLTKPVLLDSINQCLALTGTGR